MIKILENLKKKKTKRVAHVTYRKDILVPRVLRLLGQRAVSLQLSKRFRRVFHRFEAFAFWVAANWGTLNGRERSTLNLRDRKIMWEKLSLSTSEKVCVFFFQLYNSGELETWLEKSLYHKKNTPIENNGIEAT